MPIPNDMREQVARAVLAEVPVGYGMTESEAGRYADAAILATLRAVRNEFAARANASRPGTVDCERLVAHVRALDSLIREYEEG